MFEQIITPRAVPVVTPEQVASFGRFDLPQKYVYGSSPQVYTDDYQMLLTFIEAATDEVENIAATACLYEQILLTFDFFPGQQDPRNMFFGLNYTYTMNPFWWYGFPTKDSLELVRRPVLVPSGSPVINNLVLTYNDANNGASQVMDPSTYTVFANKVTLNVDSAWPETDRRQDCIQVLYWAGYSASDPTQVPPRLIMAILYLATHMYNVRQVISVEKTSEVGMTLNRMLSSFYSYRLPR